MTSQDEATQYLEQWQALRRLGLAPEERLERLFVDVFSPPMISESEYDAQLRYVAEQMEDA